MMLEAYPMVPRPRIAIEGFHQLLRFRTRLPLVMTQTPIPSIRIHPPSGPAADSTSIQLKPPRSVPARHWKVLVGPKWETVLCPLVDKILTRSFQKLRGLKLPKGTKIPAKTVIRGRRCTSLNFLTWECVKTYDYQGDKHPAMTSGTQIGRFGLAEKKVLA
jgi:hypothetical protein